jgi:hypothetical protein
LELFTNPGEVLLLMPLPAATDQSSQIAPMPTSEPIPTASSPVLLVCRKRQRDARLFSKGNPTQQEGSSNETLDVETAPVTKQSVVCRRHLGHLTQQRPP